MPCVDCIEVKAELAAQRTLMMDWFQIFLNEMKSSKGEVLLKLERLEQKTDEGMKSAGVQVAEFQREILGKLEKIEWKRGVKPAFDIEFQRDVSEESGTPEVVVAAQQNEPAEEGFLERPLDNSWGASSGMIEFITVKTESGWDGDNSGTGIKIDEEVEPRSSEMDFPLPQPPCSRNSLIPIPQSCTVHTVIYGNASDITPGDYVRR